MAASFDFMLFLAQKIIYRLPSRPVCMA